MGMPGSLGLNSLTKGKQSILLRRHSISEASGKAILAISVQSMVLWWLVFSTMTCLQVKGAYTRKKKVESTRPMKVGSKETNAFRVLK